MSAEQEISVPAIEVPEADEKKNVFPSETAAEVEEKKEQSAVVDTKEAEDAAEEAIAVANGPSTETPSADVESDKSFKDLVDAEEDPPTKDVDIKTTNKDEKVDEPTIAETPPEEKKSQASIEPVKEGPTVEDAGETASTPETKEEEEEPVSASDYKEAIEASVEKPSDLITE